MGMTAEGRTNLFAPALVIHVMLISDAARP